MENLNIKLRNCFGIKSFDQNFKFDKKKVHLIYAPNGCMKTSFAKTMRYISGQTKEKPLDYLNPEASVVNEITIGDKTISQELLYVVNGEDEIDSSKSFINFLASSELKAKYDAIYIKLRTSKDLLMAKLKSKSMSSDCEKEIIDTFSKTSNDTIYSILESLNTKIREGLPYYDFKYNDIFDAKGYVKDFLDKYNKQLKEYIENYEKLIKESTLFRSVGDYKFGTYHASQLVQYVSDGAFFGVQHKIVLQNGKEITSTEQLQQLISEEQQRILEDDKLKKSFAKITKAIDKNTDLRGFKAVIENHPEWIIEIINYDDFRKKVWLGHLSHAEIKPLFDSYITVYNENKKGLLDILSKASLEQDRWKEIITLYNSRFHVPIKVSIQNQRDIILKQEAAKLQFSYVEKDKSYDLKDKRDLDKILSRGEKRAFTILQFIFEMEARKENAHESIIIMDDIADSFDYQNKYAIIEYIKDLAENDKFYMIILTHNYDFYRTVSSRLSIGNKNLWMIDRLDDGTIIINTGQYKGDVYCNAFVGHDDNNKIFISMIPFVRNLIQYTKGNNSPEYLTLTSCLHLKKDTKNITESQITNIIRTYNNGKELKRADSCNKIYDLILNTADEIMSETSPNAVFIENKIVLSIAIRLLTEKYIYKKLISKGKKEEDLETTSNQTANWTKLYKKEYPSDKNRYIIEKVNMMTPEIIHINSFMFEPLIDMSIYHLIELYKDCKNELK